MNLTFTLFFNSVLLGVGLAMDAFSVSLANGLNEPCMKKRKMCAVAGMFAFFQALMPVLGWICIKTISKYFEAFEKMVPYIALALLSYIGGKMLYEGIKNKDNCDEKSVVGFVALIVQGIATSIDALSAGLAFEEYVWQEALTAALLIAAVTFVICLVGIIIGRKAGTCLAGKAGILGGIILIFIGLEIFITSFF